MKAVTARLGDDELHARAMTFLAALGSDLVMNEDDPSTERAAEAGDVLNEKIGQMLASQIEIDSDSPASR